MPRKPITEKYITKKISPLAGKTVVKIFTQEGVRELIVPSNEPNYYPLLLTKDRLSILEEHAAKSESTNGTDRRNLLSQESKERKAKFKEIDAIASKKSQRLSELEHAAKEKSNYLLQRAWELRMEQEDAVKAANSLILKTKCQAIRDAQLAEKEMIKNKIEQEEEKVEKLAELERLKMLLEEKREADKEATKKDKYVRELTKQVEEIQSQKLLESEKVMQERKKLNEAMYMMLLEDMKKNKQEELRKAKTRKELAIANEQIKKAHELEREEARIADLKVQEWMRQRAEREEALERRQMDAKKKRELETARLRSMQEKAGELQARQDEMAAVRRQEEYEREWRKKEKEEVKKRKEREDKCLEVRDKQVKEIREIQAMEIVREKREYEKIINIQKEKEERERLLNLKRRQEAEEYRENLLRQMNEKEADAAAARAAELAEGIAARAEEAKRQDEIRRVLRNKVAVLRNNKVPEMYVSDIMRQLHLENQK